MAEILAARKSPQLVSPALELLNSVVDSDLDDDYEATLYLPGYVTFSRTHTYTRGLSRTQRLPQPAITGKSKT